MADVTDLEQAVDWLRKKGLSKAANKAGRIAAEGLIGVTAKDKVGAMVEVNSETDFVARNDRFQDMVRTIASLAPKAESDLKKLLGLTYTGKSATVEEHVKEMVATKKPVGFACIAPVLAARVLGGLGLNPKLTIGTDKGTADAIRSMNASHVDTGPTDVCVDEVNRIVSTPCYMNDVGPWTVYQGAERMIQELLRMTGAN